MMEGTDVLSAERAPSPFLLAGACLLPFENITARLQECHGVERTAIVTNFEMDESALVFGSDRDKNAPPGLTPAPAAPLFQGGAGLGCGTTLL